VKKTFKQLKMLTDTHTTMRRSNNENSHRDILV
jgi:hypothetical protein